MSDKQARASSQKERDINAGAAQNRKNSAGSDQAVMQQLTCVADTEETHLSGQAVDEERYIHGLLGSIHHRIMTVLDHQCSRHRDPLKALEKIFLSHLRFAANNPLLISMLHYLMGKRESPIHKQVTQIIRQYEYDVMLILRRAKRDGSIQQNVNPRESAVLFVAMLQGAVLRLGISTGRESVLEDAGMMLRAFLNGLSQYKEESPA